MRLSLLVKKGASKPQVFTFDAAEIVIGRQKGCQVRIPDAAVSRQHCALSWGKKGLYIEDLQSANGTFVNDEPVTKRFRLEPGDLLQIGPLVFKVDFKFPPEEEEETAPVIADKKKKKKADTDEGLVIVEEDETVPTMSTDNTGPNPALQSKKGDKAAKPPPLEPEEESNADADAILNDRSGRTTDVDFRNLLSQMDDE